MQYSGGNVSERELTVSKTASSGTNMYNLDHNQKRDGHLMMFISLYNMPCGNVQENSSTDHPTNVLTQSNTAFIMRDAIVNNYPNKTQ